MKSSEIAPDKALTNLLDRKVVVQISATQSRKIKVYANAEQPQDGLSDEFVSIFYNGTLRSRTKPLGIISGNIALAIYCKSYSDGTAKRNRIDSMVEQIVKLVNCKSEAGFFFELDTANFITPTTVNLTNGYTTTILNVHWHN